MQPITLAFAGPGAVDLENVKALLNDLLNFGPEDVEGFPELPDRDITIIVPATNELLSKGVQTVLDWTEYADLPYIAVAAKEGTPSKAVTKAIGYADQAPLAANPGAKITSLLTNAEGEKYLVLLWGDESDDNPDEDVLAIFDLVVAADIPVKDLCRGLDDVQVTLEGDEEPEPTPEPEPAPEPVRPSRGSRRKAPEPVAEDDEPQVAADEDDEQADPIAQAKAEGEEFKAVVKEAKAEAAAALVERRERTGYQSLEDELAGEARKARAAKVLDETVEQADAVSDLALTIVDALELAEGTLQAVYVHLRAQDEANAARNLAEVRESPLTEAVREALEALATVPGATEKAADALEVVQDAPEAQEAAEAPKRGRGRPRKDRTQEKVSFLQYEDGTLERKGRGRTPKEASLVSLTLAEAEAQGWVPEDDAA